MPKKLERQFLDELQKRKQPKILTSQSLPTQKSPAEPLPTWKIGLLWIGGLGLFAAVTISLRLPNHYKRKSLESRNPPPPTEIQASPLALPATSLINPSQPKTFEQNAFGGLTFYSRPPTESEQKELGNRCRPTAPSDQRSHFIKILDWQTEKVVQTLFLRSNENIQVQLPLGSYKIRYASGKKWYGEKLHFGNESIYQEFSEKSKSSEKSNRPDKPTYQESSDTPHQTQAKKIELLQPGAGWSFTIYRCFNGNLRSRQLNRDAF